MHYFIDGYNLLFQVVERSKTFTENRILIIENLSEFFNTHKILGSLIFDSRVEFSSHFASKHDLGNLEIIYSPRGLTADDYLLEMLSVLSNTKAVTVVTSDGFLSHQAKSLGCQTMTIEKFLKWTLKKKKQLDKIKSYEKNVQDTHFEFERLLEIFEKKLKDSDTE